MEDFEFEFAWTIGLRDKESDVVTDAFLVTASYWHDTCAGSGVESDGVEMHLVKSASTAALIPQNAMPIIESQLLDIFRAKAENNALL